MSGVLTNDEINNRKFDIANNVIGKVLREKLYAIGRYMYVCIVITMVYRLRMVGKCGA